MRKETPWGVWDHASLAAAVELVEGLPVPWWIAGGYAIDAFAGAGRRQHDDIDISVLACDQLAAQQHLRGWELHCADPPGTLRPWWPGERLAPQIHDIWARRDAGDPWRFQLMLNPGGRDEFVYRRDERIRLPFDRATCVKDGVRYLAPEVQLLFKARDPRPKDEQDFRDCLPLMSSAQRDWLLAALEAVHAGTEWCARLRSSTPDAADD